MDPALSVLTRYPPPTTGMAKPLTWSWWSSCIAMVERTRPHLNPDDVAIVALGVLSALDSESGGRVDAVGDEGHSVGLFQMHDQGAGRGLTVAQRQDPAVQFKHAEAIAVTVEEALYWSRVERESLTPIRVARAIAEVQRPSPQFVPSYANSWSRLQVEAGWKVRP